MVVSYFKPIDIERMYYKKYITLAMLTKKIETIKIK